MYLLILMLLENSMILSCLIVLNNGGNCQCLVSRNGVGYVMTWNVTI